MSTDLTVEVVDVDMLTPDPDNVRTHSARNLEAIAGSLTRFGQRRPLVVWGSTVIAGNGTLEAARSLGWERVAVARVPEGWSIEEARAYALADNRTAELAEWDGLGLLDALQSLDGDLVAAAGFTSADVDDLTAAYAEPDLDALADQHPGDGDGVSALWPLLSVRVPPTVMAAWKAHVDTYGGEAPAALAGLLGLAWDEVTT